MIERLDEKAVQRVSGPTWTPLRPHFFRICQKLLAVAPNAASRLTTIYVKFAINSEMTDVFAVVWIKNSRQVVVGLAMPDNFYDSGLSLPPEGYAYKGLTKFFIVTHEDLVPEELAAWAKAAYRNSGGTEDC